MGIRIINGTWTRVDERTAADVLDEVAPHMRDGELVVVLIDYPRARPPSARHLAVTNQRRLLLLDADGTITLAASPDGADLHRDDKLALITLTGAWDEPVRLLLGRPEDDAVAIAWEAGRAPELDELTEPDGFSPAAQAAWGAVLVVLGGWLLWTGAVSIDMRVLDELGLPLRHTPILDGSGIGNGLDVAFVLIGFWLTLKGVLQIAAASRRSRDG